MKESIVNHNVGLMLKAVMQRKIIHNGIEFSSLKKLAEHYKANYANLLYRINKAKLSLDEALLPDLAKNKYTVGHKNFLSFKAACRHYKMHPTTVLSRINIGWTKEEAFELTKRVATNICEGKVYKIINSKNSKIYIGITTKSIKDRFIGHKWSARTGKNTKLCRAMRKYGIENFSIILIKKVNSRVKMRKLEIKYINKYNSINKGYNTYYGGCHIGDKFGNTVVYKGQIFNSIQSLSDHLGFKRHVIEDRIKAGTDLGAPLNETRSKGRKVKYDGKIFNTIKDLAAYVSLTPSCVISRLKHNRPLNIPQDLRRKRNEKT